jgi:hypothetical protein
MNRQRFLFVLFILPFVIPDAPCFGQATGQRLIGRSYREGNAYINAYVLKDTTGYRYSGTNGGGIDEELKFDSSFAFTVSNGNTPNLDRYSVQAFESNGRLTGRDDYFADGVKYCTFRKQFDAAGRIASSLTHLGIGSSADSMNTREDYTYDFSGRLISDVSTYPPHSYGFKTEFTYDNAGNLINKVFYGGGPGNWTISRNSIYDYTDGNLSHLEVTEGYLTTLTDYSYDDDGRLSTDASSITNSHNNAHSTFTDTFQYDGAHQLINSIHAGRSYPANSNDPVVPYYGSVESTYNGNLVTEIHKEWLTNVKKVLLEYNSDHCLLRRQTYTWQGKWIIAGPYSPDMGCPDFEVLCDSIISYYYEPYTKANEPDTGPQEAIPSRLVVYPNPASGTVNIKMGWGEPQNFMIAIYDIQGRLVRQWSGQPVSRYSKMVPIADLAPGRYILKVMGTKEQQSSEFVVDQ